MAKEIVGTNIENKFKGFKYYKKCITCLMIYILPLDYKLDSCKLCGGETIVTIQIGDK